MRIGKYKVDLLNKSLREIFIIISLIIISIMLMFTLISFYISSRISSLLAESMVLSDLTNRFTRLHIQFNDIETNSYHFLHGHFHYDLLILKGDISSFRHEFNEFLLDIREQKYIIEFAYLELMEEQIAGLYEIINNLHTHPVSSEHTRQMYDSFFLSRLIFSRMESFFAEIKQRNAQRLELTSKLNRAYLVPLALAFLFLSTILFYQKKIIAVKLLHLNKSILSFKIGHKAPDIDYPYNDEFQSTVKTYQIMSGKVNDYIKEIQYLKSYLINIIDSMPSILISLDEKGIITQINKKAEDILNLPKAQYAGRYFWDLNTPFLKFKGDCVNLLDNSQGMRLYKSHPFNERYWDIYIFPILAKDIPGLVIRADDVTEKEKVELSLRRAQQMELIGTMAGGLAHDFNNSLGGIIGTLSLFKYKLEKNIIKDINSPEISRYINIIQNSANSSSRIVNHLLTLSKQHEIVPESFDITDAIDNVVAICRNTFEKNINIVLKSDLNDLKAEIYGDASQIEQVLLNIAINGYHAMTIMKEKEGPGTLTFSLVIPETTSELLIRHSKVKAEKLIKISIIDTGIGMDKDTIEKIWTPFFTRKKKGQGIGLGLSMVYSIIEKHGGFIEVTSEINKGSRFDIYLPLENKKSLKDEIPSLPAIKKRNGLILVIDDEENIRIVAEEILNTCGYNVILASSGKEGIDILKEHKGKIDLIVLDVIMPEKTGKETFIELRKIDKKVKIIIISGFKQDKRVDFLLSQGCLSFIQKPFDMETLSRAVNDILDAQ